VNGKICDFDQAKSLNDNGGIVLPDGIRVHCYEELVSLASSDKYKNLDIIEIVLLPAISGG
jgi:hypothetical protein